MTIDKNTAPLLATEISIRATHAVGWSTGSSVTYTNLEARGWSTGSCATLAEAMQRLIAYHSGDEVTAAPGNIANWQQMQYVAAGRGIDPRAGAESIMAARVALDAGEDSRAWIEASRSIVNDIKHNVISGDVMIRLTHKVSLADVRGSIALH